MPVHTTRTRGVGDGGVGDSSNATTTTSQHFNFINNSIKKISVGSRDASSSDNNTISESTSTSFNAPKSMILTASLLLLETAPVVPEYDDPYDSEQGQFDPIQMSYVEAPIAEFMSNLASVATSETVTKKAWASPEKTSQILSFNSKKKKKPFSLSSDSAFSSSSSQQQQQQPQQQQQTPLPEFAYLLPRPYLQNWIDWAAHQPTPPSETALLRRNLFHAAVIHSLQIPPLCDPSSSRPSPLRPRHQPNFSLSSSSPLANPQDLIRANSFSHFDDYSARTRARRSLSTGRASSPSQRQMERRGFTDPGPIDASPLSVLGYPLLLRPHVAVGKGTDEEEREKELAVKSRRGRSRSPPLRKNMPKKRSFSLGPYGHEKEKKKEDVRKTYSKVGCCVVSEGFYELLRTVHGVKCTDNVSISFQPPLTSYGSLLHHVITTPHDNHTEQQQLPQSNPETINAMPFTSTRKSSLRSPHGKHSGWDQPQPIEFKRRVIPQPYSDSHSRRPEVEIYPIKFIYSIVGDDQSTSEAGSSVVSETQPRFGEPDHVSILQTAASNLNKGGAKQQPVTKPPRARENPDRSPPPSRRRKTPHKKNLNGTVNIPPTKATNTTTNNNDDNPFPARGFLLVSRTTPASEALQELRNLAVPSKPKSCVRIWSQIGTLARRKDEQPSSKTSDDHRGWEIVDLDDPRPPPDKPSHVATVSSWVQRHTGKPSARSIELLIEVKSSPSARWPLASWELKNRLQIGDFVDAPDVTGEWYESVVKDIREGYARVHYLGWSSKWDTWISLDRLAPHLIREENDPQPRLRSPGPIAPLWSRSSQWRRYITIGTEVEVREACSLVQRPRWFMAIVRDIGKESDNPRDLTGGAHLEMTLDAKGEKRPLLLLERTQQVLVEVAQERFNVSVKVSKTPKFLAPQPPFLRWVNLYGEEICKLYTHNKPINEEEEGHLSTPATIRYAHDPTRPPVEVLRSFNNVHGAGFVRESLRGVPPAPGSVGLHNLGNTCFLNSILQCLCQFEPLTQYFIKGEYRDDLNKSNPLGSGGRVAMSYANLLNDMWSGEYSTLAPRILKKTVASFAPQFNNMYQHDSQEFCSFLMDGLHEDLNRVKDKPYVEDLEGVGMADDKVATESWKKHLLRHDSIIVDYCQGMHRSHLTCPKCNHESVKFDVYSTISLPLPRKDSITLDDCMQEFTTAEQLDEENAWFCPKCKEHVCARKLITLWSTPDILIFHLKRFKFQRDERRGGLVRIKVEDQVDFPVEGLDMRVYCMGPSDDDAPSVYKLFGVSEHSGVTANSGHYTATVRNSQDGKWYRYNDSHVGSTSGDASVTGGAYLLFYQRSKGKSRWAGMEKYMIRRHINPRGKPEDDGFVEVKGKKKKKRGGTGGSSGGGGRKERNGGK